MLKWCDVKKVGKSKKVNDVDVTYFCLRGVGTLAIKQWIGLEVNFCTVKKNRSLKIEGDVGEGDRISFVGFPGRNPVSIRRVSNLFRSSV